MVTAWPDKDDETLLAAIRSGSHHAFSTLVERHSRKFYSLAYRYLAQREAAEDILQTAFLRLWEKPHLWQPTAGAKFTTWFYRVIVNLCLDARKKYTPLPLLDGVEAEDATPDQEETMLAKRQQNQIESAIRTLPERQQTALNLCFYEECGNKEAADIMQISVKALESLLMRAKYTLKETLVRENERKQAG